MVHFKVIKGSHVFLGISIALLLLVIGGLFLFRLLPAKAELIGTHARLVSETANEMNNGAQTNTVYAPIRSEPSAIELDPDTGSGLSIELLPDDVPEKKKYRVLIYHTHTHEAYEQVDNNRYVAIEAWRTCDHSHSVVRVGQELATLLRERGFEVVHDTTDHEQNELGTAYTRSLQTLESYEQPFDLYIDLHRDAYIEGVEYPIIEKDGENLAQMMLLIGNGEGFDIKPYYTENLAFATHLTQRMNQIIPDICKDVLVKDGRYNQHVGIFSVLVEVGHNRNTLTEALNSLPCLADAIHSLLMDAPSNELAEIQRQFLNNQS